MKQEFEGTNYNSGYNESYLEQTKSDTIEPGVIT